MPRPKPFPEPIEFVIESPVVLDIDGFEVILLFYFFRTITIDVSVFFLIDFEVEVKGEIEVLKNGLRTES